MPRHRIVWSPDPVPSPLTPWVHRDAPLPRTERGFPRAIVTCRGHELVFASPEELEHAIDVLSRRNLPRPGALVRDRDPPWDWGHANSHWLSRFPAALRPYRVREPLVADLRDALEALRDALG